jgi:hypothetical protein
MGKPTTPAKIGGTKENLPAVAGAAGLPAELASLAGEMEGLAGAGTSSRADDNSVPFLYLLQDLSPEVKRRDPAYVEGAEPGCVFNRITRQLWVPDPEQDGILVDSKTRAVLEVQPCAFDRGIVEWIPRDAGGGAGKGFVGRYPLEEANVEAQMLKLGGKQVLDPKDSKGTKMIWRKGQNDLIDTRYHYVHIVHPGGGLEPVVLSFSSTGHKSSRDWMSLMRGQDAMINGQIAPSWFRKYPVKSVMRSGNGNDWFVLQFVNLGPTGWITDGALRARGEAMFRAFSAGAIRAADDLGDNGGSSGQNTGDSAPI